MPVQTGCRSTLHQQALIPLFLALATACPAVELPGIAESPRLQGMPVAWIEWGNDYFGSAPATVADDFRTNRFMGGWRAGDWYGGIDYSMLTSTFPGADAPIWGTADPFSEMKAGQGRNDELTATVGHRWTGGGRSPWWLGTGLGLRLRGDMGGESVQTKVHTAIGGVIVDLPYDPDGEEQSLLAHGQGGVLLPLGPGDSPVALRLRAAGLVTQEGEVQAHAGAHLAYRGGGGAIWWGLEQELRCGPVSPIVEDVADHEAGLWQVLGIEYGALTFWVGRGGDDPAVEGAVGYSIVPEPTPGSGARGTIEYGVPVDGSLDGGSGQAALLRLEPWWLPADDWWSRHGALVLDWRRTELTTRFSYDLRAWWEEVLVGGELQAFANPADGLWANPFLVLTGGLHHGAIETPGITKPCPEAEVLTGVVRAGAGVRWTWGWTEGERRWRTGVTTLLDWVQTGTTTTVPYSTKSNEVPPQYTSGETTIAQPGWEAVIRWSGSLEW